MVSAIGVLIGSLTAAGLIGGDDDNPGSPAAAVTATSGDATSSSAGGFDRITQHGGTWMSDYSAPDTVSRIAIAGSGTPVNVHAFAACAPVDCDWGTRSPSFADPLVALFELGNGRTEKLTMLLSSDGSRLAVTEQSSLRGIHEFSFHR